MAKPFASLTFRERFNQHALAYIVANYEDFAEEISKTAHKDAFEVKTQITKYLKKSRGGYVDVTYAQKAGKGRFNAKRSLSQQNIARAVRHTIAKIGGADIYWDIDQVNSHPVIADHEARKNRWHAPLLNEYVTDRERILAKIAEESGKTRGDAKQAICKALNDNYERPMKPSGSEWLDDFRRECRELQYCYARRGGADFDAHAQKTEPKRPGEPANVRGSWISLCMQEVENEILEVMWDFFGRRTDVVLCFDGIQLPRAAGDAEPDLAGCEAAIFAKTGVPMKLAAKPFDQGVTIPEGIPRHVDDRLYYADYESICVGPQGKSEVSYAEAAQWANEAMLYAHLGGKSMFVTFSLDYNAESRAREVQMDFIKPADLSETLSRKQCNVINPQYDREDHEQFALLGNSKAFRRLMIDKHGPQNSYDCYIKRYSHTNLMDFVKHLLNVGELREYNKVNFAPYPPGGDDKGILAPGDYNTFRGFALYDEPPSPIKFEETAWYRHLTTGICQDPDLSRGEATHFMNFIAGIIQRPAEKYPSIHILYGEQGTGKSIVQDWLHRLLGSEYCVRTGNVKDFLENKFNTQYCYKLLVTLEEVPKKGAAFTLADQMKYITASTRRSHEVKFGPAQQINFYDRLMINTNNPRVVQISPDDRRDNIHEMHPELNCRNEEYKKALLTEMNSNQHIKAAFDFFANFQFDDDMARRVFRNSAFHRGVEDSMGAPLKFLKRYIETHFSQHREGDPNAMIYRVPVSDMCSAFVTDHASNRNHFLNKMKELGLQQKRARTTNTASTPVFVVYPPTVRKLFVEKLKNPDFQFDYIGEDEHVDILEEVYPEPSCGEESHEETEESEEAPAAESDATESMDSILDEILGF